jgi:hypothetical protein
MSGSWTQKGWDRFGRWPLQLWGGKIILAEGIHDCGGRAMPLLNCTLAFALQLRKSTENFSQCSWIVSTLLVPTWPSFWDSLCWPAEHQCTLVTHGWLQSALALGRHKCLPSFWTKGFPHQLTLSQNSQSVLLCDWRRMESPNPHEFACYQRTKVCQSQCEDIWIVTLVASGCGRRQWTSRSDMCSPA